MENNSPIEKGGGILFEKSSDIVFSNITVENNLCESRTGGALYFSYCNSITLSEM